MADKRFDLIKYFDGVTNADIESFVFKRKENGEEIREDVFTLISSMDYSRPLFFRLDAKTGNVSRNCLNTSTLKGINDCNLFSRQVVAYYYSIIHSDMVTIRDELKKVNVNDLNEKHVIAYNVVSARIANAIDICNAAGQNIDCIDAAKNVARVFAKASVKSFGDKVVKSMGKVISELESLYAAKLENDQLPNVKQLRNDITDVIAALLPIDNDGICQKVTRRCTDAHARDVFALYYDGRKTNALGDVTSKNAKDSKIINEIMLIAIQCMQVNSPEIVIDKPAKAAKAAEPAKAAKAAEPAKAAKAAEPANK